MWKVKIPVNTKSIHTERMHRQTGQKTVRYASVTLHWVETTNMNRMARHQTSVILQFEC